MHGPGRLAFPDGIEYEGGMADGTMTGTGVYRWPGARYEGEVVNGRRHGCGTLSFDASPAVYDGQWADGLRHGSGTLWFDADRTSFYQGEWCKDMKQGQGTMVYPSGNNYSGQWAADARSGVGEMQWHTLGQTYVGQWESGLPCGLGEHTWEVESEGGGVGGRVTCLMHNRYRGTFKAGQRHGEGALLYSSGARYEGGWAGGRKEGEGVYIFEDGTVFSGPFLADRPDVVKGIFTYGSAGPPPGSAPSAVVATAAAQQQGASNDPKRDQQQQQQPATAGAVVPGFGPRVSVPQLYIDDLLGEEDAPTAAARAVVNLLTGYASELRALYERYCKRASPFLDPSAPRWSFGLRLAQLWELARDAGLISCNTPLVAIDTAAARARAPPPAVAARRWRVLQAGSEAAGAVLGDALGQWPVFGVALQGAAGGQAPPRGKPHLDVCAFGGGDDSGGAAGSGSSSSSSGSSSSSSSSSSSTSSGSSGGSEQPPADTSGGATPGERGCADTGAPGARSENDPVWFLAATAPHDPRTELTPRDFAECLVRIAAQRYPHIGPLSRRVQAALQHHAVPLLGTPGRRQGGQQAGLAEAAGPVVATAPVRLAAGGSQHRSGGATGVPQSPRQPVPPAVPPTWEQQLVSEEVVSYLRSRSAQLQAAFTSVAVPSPPAAAAAQSHGVQLPGSGAAADAAHAWGHTTVRSALRRFHRSGVLKAFGLTAGDAAALLLETHLGAQDAPQAPRLRLDCGPEEGPGEVVGSAALESDAEAEAANAAAAAAAEAEWRARQVAAWADQPLTYAEFVWGLTRIAQALPPPGVSQQTRTPPAVAGGRSGVGAAEGRAVGGSGLLLGSLQRLLDGPNGLLESLGAMRQSS